MRLGARRIWRACGISVFGRVCSHTSGVETSGSIFEIAVLAVMSSCDDPPSGMADIDTGADSIDGSDGPDVPDVVNPPFDCVLI